MIVDTLVELVGGGFVINGAYPVSFGICLVHISLLYTKMSTMNKLLYLNSTRRVIELRGCTFYSVALTH